VSTTPIAQPFGSAVTSIRQVGESMRQVLAPEPHERLKGERTAAVGGLWTAFGDWRDWQYRQQRLRSRTVRGLSAVSTQVLAEAAGGLISHAILRRTLTPWEEQEHWWRRRGRGDFP
jgi:hypothetical protein